MWVQETAPGLSRKKAAGETEKSEPRQGEPVRQQSGLRRSSPSVLDLPSELSLNDAP